MLSDHPFECVVRSIKRSVAKPKTERRIPALIWVSDAELCEQIGIDPGPREVVAVPSPSWTATVAPDILFEYLLTGDGTAEHWDAVRLLPKKMRDELAPQKEFLMRPGRNMSSPKQLARNAEMFKGASHEEQAPQATD